MSSGIGQTHDDAIEAVKESTAAETILKYLYDNSKELTMQYDSSDYGLGAAILQNGAPITCESQADRH